VLVFGLALPVVGDLVAVPSVDMAVDAVEQTFSLPPRYHFAYGGSHS
jgi:hypothetical protein